MKKIVKIILLIAGGVLLLQIIVNIFITKQEEKYTITNNNMTFKIDENYQKEKDNDYYNIVIQDNKKRNYFYTINKNYNKQEEIIKDIIYLKEGNVECIYPIFKRNYVDTLECYYDKKLVSYTYLKQIKNKNIEKIGKKLKKMGYDTNINKKETSGSKDKNIKIYRKNILDNYIFTVWNYKGLNIIKEGKSYDKKLLNKDKYENKLATLVGKYYVFIDTNKKEYEEINIFDIEQMKNKTYKIKDYSLSTEIYFNGVDDNLLYITDMTNKKQYVFDPEKEEIKELEEEFISIEDNKIKKYDKDKFFKKKYIFNDVVNKDITKKYKTEEIKKSGNYYYVKRSGNKLYKIDEKNIDNTLLLGEFSNIKEWNVKDNNLIIIEEGILYFYNEKEGLLPIIESNELKYNYKNICDFWVKEK